MQNDNIIPFTMEIKGYHNDGTYDVEYRPTDPDCHNIQIAINISLLDTDADTEEKIINRLAQSSPQYYWRQQKLATEFDHGIRKSLIGQVHEDAHSLIPIDNFELPRPSSPVAEYIPKSNSSIPSSLSIITVL
jgi:hypothetical protein